MAYTWADFLTEIRVELDDTSGTPRWTDAALYVFARDGLWDYSNFFPLRCDHEAVSADPANDMKYTLPTSFIDEVFVECPLGNYLDIRRERPGVRIATSNVPLFYYIDAGFLYLDASPGDDAVLLSYYGAHGIPASAADTTFAMTIPLGDIEVLKLYVLARVNTIIRNRQANLDRFKLGSGTREDNPIAQETTDYYARYNEAIAKRLRPTAVRLYRPRRNQ